MNRPNIRYIHLLVTLSAIFILQPLMGYSWWGGLIILALVFWAIIVITHTLLPRRTFQAYLGLACFGFAVQTPGLLQDVTGIPLFAADLALALNLLGKIIFVGFFLVPIRSIIRQLFQERQVSVNTLRGCICVYLLIGTLWSILYDIVYTVNPEAFVFHEPATWQALYYFSFVTLTTVGFGDIVPAAPLARTMTNVEAIIGQMYIAIIVARVVALYCSPWQSPPSPEPSIQGKIEQSQ